MTAIARSRRCLVVSLLLILGLPQAASGHHILGIPHYAYDEQYPQVPILTYRVDAGPYEVKLTGYPGKPEPGDYCTLHVCIQRLDDGEPLDDNVVLRVFRDRMIGEDPLVYGPVEAQLEEAVYKFHPRFESEANYVARIEFEADGAPWTIELPMVVGEPGSPWLVLGGIAAAVILFLTVIRAFRIKMRRRAKQEIAA